MHLHDRILVSGVALTAALLASSAAQAQTESRANDDIIVTATRSGAANVQDVPIAITAFGAEQIENKGIDDPTDLQFHVPNLSVVPESQGSVTFGIRGINVAVDSFSFDNAVGV
jgi:iron complex outermembrane receptor protein